MAVDLAEVVITKVLVDVVVADMVVVVVGQVMEEIIRDHLVAIAAKDLETWNTAAIERDEWMTILRMKAEAVVAMVPIVAHIETLATITEDLTTAFLGDNV